MRSLRATSGPLFSLRMVPVRKSQAWLRYPCQVRSPWSSILMKTWRVSRPMRGSAAMGMNRIVPFRAGRTFCCAKAGLASVWGFHAGPLVGAQDIDPVVPGPGEFGSLVEMAGIAEPGLVAPDVLNEKFDLVHIWNIALLNPPLAHREMVVLSRIVSSDTLLDCKSHDERARKGTASRTLAKGLSIGGRR